MASIHVSIVEHVLSVTIFSHMTGMQALLVSHADGVGLFFHSLTIYYSSHSHGHCLCLYQPFLGHFDDLSYTILFHSRL